MKFIDEFRNKEIAQGLIRKIFEVSTRPIQLMEVCGQIKKMYGQPGILAAMLLFKAVPSPQGNACVVDFFHLDSLRLEYSAHC